MIITTLILLQQLLIITPSSARATPAPLLISTDIVISQVYGGGGNSGATLTNDFIELFNPGTSAVSVNGWSVQYASAAGTTWQVTNLTNVTVQPGQYFLVQQAQGAGGTTPLPTPDASGTIAMSATAGKVAVVKNTTALTGSCPSSADIADFVGFGSAATCFEGAGPTGTLSNTTAAVRGSGGCTDTDVNSSDFTVTAPTPRNTSSAQNPCGGGSTNPTGVGAADPPSVQAGNSSLLTVTVTPGQNPTSTGLAVIGDLTPIGGSATQQFFDDGTNGDVSTGDKIFSFSATVNLATAPGPKSLNTTITDSQVRSGNATINLTIQSPPGPETVVISQVYGGGGNAGALYTHDFIELFNNGSSPVSLSGWSVQYTSAAGTTWQVTPITGTIAPGGYHLVQQAAGAGGSTALPTPDNTGGIAMGANMGKVALRTTTTAASGACPSDWIDLVGYGAANCFEGAGPTSVTSNTTAALRKRGGCFDSDNNTFDFTIGGPNPRNGASPIRSCAYAAVSIYQIQGNGLQTPFLGQDVSTSGLVTGLKSNGFFLQESPVDADPNTSDGIFVFTSGAPSVATGDSVAVRGTASEFFNLTQIESTLTGDVVVNSSGNPLPAPVVLTQAILDPTGSPFQLERFEGMRVSAASVRSVAPTNDFGEIFTVLEGVDRPFREPGIDATLPVPPDPTSGLVDCCVAIWDRNPERIMIDTDGLVGSTRLNVTSNVGLSDITGPLEFSFDEYKILSESTPVQTTQNMSAVSVSDPLAGEFTVAGFNIENFNNNPVQRQKAALHIRSNMRSPDIIGTIEIANLTSLQALAVQVNSDTVAGGDPDPQYQAYLIPAPQGGTQHVGFLVKTSRIQVDSVTQERATDTFINPNTGLPELLHDRPPLVLRATVNPLTDPRPVIVVVNHLRSFIDVELVGGDGPRVRAKRKAQAEATAELLQDLQSSNANTPVISVGDYNAYQFSDGYTDPIATLKGTPTADEEIVVDASPDVVDPNFVNLTDTLPDGERYSFIFEGTPQALDHVLVNEAAYSILQRYAITRSNPDFPAVAPFTDVTRPEASSDHDSPVAYFKFPARATTTSVSDVKVTYNVSGQSVLLTANVTAAINTVNEGTVTFTVTTLDGSTVIGTAGPATVTNGIATANFALPGTVLPQALKIEASFTGGLTTLSSEGEGTLTVSFAICALYDETKAVNSGAVYPIKLQLCDVNGVNVSNPGIVVRATSVTLVSATDTELEVVDTGNANPDNNFRFDTALDGYIFNLNTSGLASGIYSLNFTAGDDPTVHSVEFRVK